MDENATALLARYVAGERYDRLPADAIAKAKLCLLDAIGCLLGAYETPVATAVEALVAADSPAGDVRVPGSARATGCSLAAFANATLINALDFDDIHAKGHLGATAIAAALAVGDKQRCSGKEIVEAIVVGYEVSGRVGRSLLQSQPRKAVHGHGTWQVFGAVAAAAKLMKLAPREAAQAIAIAGSNAPVASVMKTVYGARPSMAKNNFGAAAQAGVNAALLAGRGFDGPLDLFEGETGFWRMFGADGCDRERLTGGLGERYEIGAVGFKPYSCCRIIQSSVEAAVDVFAQAGADAQRDPVESLTVHAPPIVCGAPFDNRRPDSLSAAQFSAPFAIAMALAHVEPGPQWFAPHRFADPQIHRLSDLVALRPLAADGARGHHAAAARLVLRDGRTFRAQVDVARGDAARPLPVDFLRTKFARLASPRLGASRATEAMAAIEAVETLDSVCHLAALLLPGPAYQSAL